MKIKQELVTLEWSDDYTRGSDEGVYSGEERETLLEDDQISAEEAGFMEGYCT